MELYDTRSCAHAHTYDTYLGVDIGAVAPPKSELQIVKLIDEEVLCCSQLLVRYISFS